MSEVSAYAPGRAEWLGNHVDYNEGCVLAIALGLGTTVRGRARPDGAIHLRSTAFQPAWEGRADSERLPDEPAWVRTPLAVLAELRRSGVEVGGMYEARPQEP